MTKISCSMCGHNYDPSAHLRCTECPIKKGCELSCCPNCGYETIDIEQSSLVRFISRLLSIFSSGENKNDIELVSSQKN